MKIIYVLFVVLLLAGCTESVIEKVETTKTTVETELPKEPPSITENIVAEKENIKVPEVKDEKIAGSENINEIKDVIKPSDRLLIYPTAKVIDNSDSYQYTLGVYNQYGKVLRAYVEIRFFRAMSPDKNEIYANQSIVNSWIKTNDFIFEVPERNPAFAPVNVTVPDEAKPGYYEFFVSVYDADKITENDKDLYYKTKMTITVPDN